MNLTYALKELCTWIGKTEKGKRPRDNKHERNLRVYIAIQLYIR